MSQILYIHGMGGGGDSRIPRLLNEHFAGSDIHVTVRTYSFHPEEGHRQILSWVEELRPDLLIGESLGAVQTLRIPHIPKLFVSPSLGGADNLYRRSILALIPGMRFYFTRILFPVKEGDRQRLDFTYRTLRSYGPHSAEAMRLAAEDDAPHYAFFGMHDHYMKSGVVSVERWEALFGKDSYEMYDGSHFMEEEYVYSMLVPKILQMLK